MNPTRRSDGQELPSAGCLPAPNNSTEPAADSYSDHRIGVTDEHSLAHSSTVLARVDVSVVISTMVSPPTAAPASADRDALDDCQNARPNCLSIEPALSWGRGGPQHP
jgi:hypothetical protein